MIQKKKRKRLGFAPMGTPGAGRGWHRSAAARGSGRLGTALRRSRKSATTTPKPPKKPKAPALAEWENEGGEVDAPTAPVERSKKSAKKSTSKAGVKSQKGTSEAGGKSRPRKQAGKDVTSGPAPSTQSPVGSARQKRARTVAKDARKKEAGLEGRRIGKASASGKRAQARRDSKQ